MNSLLSLVTVIAGVAGAVALLLAGSRRGILPTILNPPEKPEEPSRSEVAAALLQRVICAGGVEPDAARALVRERLGASPPDLVIDFGNWAERYAAVSSREERNRLLELAVELAMLHTASFTAAQYDALLDLAFGLGFQTDALARLRSRYGFAYVDHARDRGPREAGRGGSRVTLFSAVASREQALAVLELGSDATRHDVVSAYRRLASRCHPDHMVGATDEERLESAERFIELTSAYETLLRIFPNH